jgi:hypothetical protein
MATWILLLGPVSAVTPPAPVVVVVEPTPSHQINPLYTGCHSDSGFVHQVRGFSSQMIFGESFEQPQPNHTAGVSSNAWSFHGSDGATSTVQMTTVAPAAHGASSRMLTISNRSASALDAPFALLRNRGLGNEGLFIEAGKPYEGYFFARCAAPVTLVVRLEDYVSSNAANATSSVAAAPLAEQTIDFKCGKKSADEWVKLDFELQPTRGTECVGIAVGSDPDVHCTRPTDEAGHSCVRCGGQFAVGLTSVGSVSIDYVVLQPGEWGRLGKLPVRRSAANVLQEMGITALRVGGSFASVTGWPDGGGGTPASTVSGEYYQWQKWTGPPWLRPSVGSVWNAYSGTSYSLIGGWGPFEVIDMCNALSIEPIITTTSSSTPGELADLVEYCHGDAQATPMGRKRASDGHPEPYRVYFFELGNEQYNGQFVEQVGAMEARAGALGLNGTMRLRYIFPDNGGLRGADIEAAKILGIDEQIVTDIHVGAGGGVELARDSLFEQVPFSVVNLETNAGTHNMQRALDEASDLNDFFSAPASTQRRLLVRTASFCTERSGHYDMFDQGISFFLPNMSWLQPPGHVHAMVASTKQPNGHNVSLLNASIGGRRRLRRGWDAAHEPTASNGGFSISAQSSEKGDVRLVRFVNPFATPIGPGGTYNLSTEVRLGREAGCTACSLTTLAAADTTLANPSWDPERVSPRRGGRCAVVDGGMATVPLAPFSYNVIEFTGCAPL